MNNPKLEKFRQWLSELRSSPGVTLSDLQSEFGLDEVKWIVYKNRKGRVCVSELGSPKENKISRAEHNANREAQNGGKILGMTTGVSKKAILNSFK